MFDEQLLIILFRETHFYESVVFQMVMDTKDFWSTKKVKVSQKRETVFKGQVGTGIIDRQVGLDINP